MQNITFNEQTFIREHECFLFETLNCKWRSLTYCRIFHNITVRLALPLKIYFESVELPLTLTPPRLPKVYCRK